MNQPIDTRFVRIVLGVREALDLPRGTHPHTEHPPDDKLPAIVRQMLHVIGQADQRADLLGAPYRLEREKLRQMLAAR